MTTIRKIVTSKIDGDSANNTDTNEIRPFGETAFYLDTNNNPYKLVLMMFDGSRTHLKSKVLSPGVLFGSNADSGDGAGYDTIKLIPDATLYSQGSQQYLIVDPTTPSHIHLRAGGPQDDSGASLYIGGENSNLNIPIGPNPPILITANSNTWTFDTSGNLSVPGVIYNNDTSNVGQLLLAGDAGEPATYLALPSDVGSTSMNVRLGNINGNIQLNAGNNGWLFNNTGELALPNGSMLYESSFIAASGTNAVLSQFDTNTQVYTMDYAVGVQTHNSGTYHTWLFNNGGDLQLPRGGVITENIVTNEVFGTTTTSVTLTPPNGWDPNMRLDVYPTEGGEGNHLHLTAGDQTSTDLYLGNDSQYVSIRGGGNIEVKARNGIDSPTPGTPAGSGSDLYLSAGRAGYVNDPSDGAAAGSVYVAAGESTTGTGGIVQILSGYGPQGYGFVEISTDGNMSRWKFDKNNQLLFPDGTVQLTAWTSTSVVSTASTIDITNTNGLGTTYYLTFVENRTTGQEVRADVDLTYQTADNILGVGQISVNAATSATSTTTGALTVAGGVGVQGDIYAGNIYSNGVQLTAGGGGGNSFSTIAVAGQSNVEAESSSDTLTLEAGSNITITTNSATDTITISATAGGGAALEEPFEIKTTGTGVTVFDCNTNRLFYQTGLTGNITPNFTNLGLATGEATSVSIVVVQGVTARNVSGVQVAGTTTGVTLIWQGSATAPSGNNSRTDVFTFSILCTATSAYTVLGMLTSFGGV